MDIEEIKKMIPDASEWHNLTQKRRLLAERCVEIVNTIVPKLITEIEELQEAIKILKEEIETE